MNIRENWRILLLVIIVLLSAVGLFMPTGDGNSNTNVSIQTRNNSTVPNSTAVDDGPTNLQFGLELSGGTRIRAPLIGLTAEDVQFNTSNTNQLEQRVATELSLSTQDVAVRAQSQDGGTVEVFDANVSKQEFAAALQAQGKDVQASDIRDGVTQATRENAVNVLDRKIKGAGLSGGDAAITTSATGNSFIVVEVPNKQPEEVTELIDERGTVQVVAHFPVTNNGTREYRNVPLFTQKGAQVQPATQMEGGAAVPVSLTEPAARNFSHAMREFGFTQPNGIENCRYPAQPNNSGYCLYTVSNGKIVNGTITEGQIVSGVGMGADGLPQSINNRNFVENPQFQIETTNISEAQRIGLNLQAGALPAELDIEHGGTTTFIQPSQANEFKLYSVVTGFIAMLAVGGMVAFRYREPRIAIPMVATAVAEVFILLGFAAAIGLAIDLSHIAGFIAVVGTGVDDLVIIADEILQQGDVSTNRVFRSRFRKAFWVIGAAAATTIIAMLPLAVLSLGDLQGFALITITGVLIGVLITRPAYGDVLRNLILKKG